MHIPTRALAWAIFTAAVVIVVGLCVAILHPFAHVIARGTTHTSTLTIEAAG